MLSCEAVNGRVYPIGIGHVRTLGIALIMDSNLNLYGGPLMEAGLGLTAVLNRFSFDLYADPGMTMLLRRFFISPQKVFFTTNSEIKQLLWDLEATLLLIAHANGGPAVVTRPVTHVYPMDSYARAESLVGKEAFKEPDMRHGI